MGIHDRAQERWSARSGGGVEPAGGAAFPVTVSAQVPIARPAGEVWERAWDPTTSVAIDESTTSAFVLPGTPMRSVGEVQCEVKRLPNGGLYGSLTEIVELEWGRRAVTKSLTMPSEDRMITEVIPVGEAGCVLRHSHTLHAVAPDALAAHQASVQAYVDRIKELLEAIGGPSN